MNAFTPIHAVPENVEAEQQTLGAILAENSRYHAVAAAGGDRLFLDPVHRAIFEHVGKLVRDDMLASPVSLKAWANAHDGLSQLGGAVYLTNLVAASFSGSQVDHYTSLLREVRSRRDLSEALSEAMEAVTRGDEPAAAISGMLENRLLASQLDSPTGPVSMTRATTKAMELVAAALDGTETGFVRSGIASLDHFIGGFYNGELSLIGGRPSMGKTALALSIALNVAHQGNWVCIASLEMNPEAMAIRAISEATCNRGPGVEYSNLRRGSISSSQLDLAAEAARTVATLPIQFLSRAYSDIGALTSGVKQSERIMGGVDLVIVDYAQLLRSTARTRYEQITEISISLKALAGQLDVPVIALSQLSRALEQREDKRPIMADLRESGQLEQDADTVLFCYRPEYYLERDKPDAGSPDRVDWEAEMSRHRYAMEILVAKQRQGEIGTAHVKCNPAFNRIWEA